MICRRHDNDLISKLIYQFSAQEGKAAHDVAKDVEGQRKQVGGWSTRDIADAGDKRFGDSRKDACRPNVGEIGQP